MASAPHDAAEDGGRHQPRSDTPGALAKLALGALGIVYGDIGTSPLYAVKE
ncbi:MAG: KUP/HAK/KT family potassium transporter, partial [Polyangia bacterium]